MTVGQLVAKLQQMPIDAQVVIAEAQDDGDSRPRPIEQVDAPEKHPNWEHWGAFANKVVIW